MYNSNIRHSKILFLYEKLRNYTRFHFSIRILFFAHTIRTIPPLLCHIPYIYPIFPPKKYQNTES